MVERRRQLAELLQLLLARLVEQRVTGWGLREHVVQLRHVRNDGLLVWFGGINICKASENTIRFWAHYNVTHNTSGRMVIQKICLAS